MKHFLIVILLCPVFVFAQENRRTEFESEFEPRPEFYIYMINHNNFGDNYLSEANDPNFLGVGLQINAFKAYNFKIGIGGEYMEYTVTNKTLGGNINKSFYYAAYLKLQYEIDFKDSWAVEPLIGIGRTRIHQKSGSKDFDDFYGTAFYIGSNLLYKFTDHVAVYLGAYYNYTQFDVKTAAAYKDFFQKANQIQVQLGLIFSIGNN
ncbi:hypothetical protein [Bizionia sp.]|uniref:hypothetical protein n=1 Tax=Bizionia sp. TaxID=1954480 RepID=UPI003A910F20